MWKESEEARWKREGEKAGREIADKLLASIKADLKIVEES